MAVPSHFCNILFRGILECLISELLNLGAVLWLHCLSDSGLKLKSLSILRDPADDCEFHILPSFSTDPIWKKKWVHIFECKRATWQVEFYSTSDGLWLFFKLKLKSKNVLSLKLAENQSKCIVSHTKIIL